MKKILMIVTIFTLLIPAKAFGQEKEAVSENTQTITTDDKKIDLTINQAQDAIQMAPIIHEQHSYIQQNESVENSTFESEEQTKEASPVVNIVDPALKKMILTTLRLPDGSDVTEENMAKLMNLNIGNPDIASLSGLEYAINLVNFDMGTNKVTDFSPIANLPKLKYVSLQAENVTSQNFPNFNHSESIIRLDLSKADIDDTIYEKIVKLTHLTSLYFDTNPKITTIAPLKVLPELTLLRLQFCSVSDFSVLTEFPKLNNLSAFGQNIGQNGDTTTIKATNLSYDSDNQTLFIPFSLMPNRLTNFDGYVPPFTTSTSSNDTFLSFNDVEIPADRLYIDAEGITVSNVTHEEFENLATLSYNARINNANGSYAKPDHYVTYSINGGTYLHNFVIDHKPIQTYQIKYDGNGFSTGEVPVDMNAYFEEDSVTVLDEGSLTKEGATFAGWNTQADGNGITYQPGDVIQLTENLTLYAQWNVVADQDEEENIEEPSSPITPTHPVVPPSEHASSEENTAQSVASNQQAQLPKTGEKNNFSVSLVGWSIALSMLGYLLLQNKRKTHH